jgi:O-antigen ligase
MSSSNSSTLKTQFVSDLAGDTRQLGRVSLSQVVEGWLNTPLITIVGFVSLFGVAIFNLIDIEVDNAKVSAGGQAVIKIGFLALGGLYGGVGFLTDGRVRKLLFSFPVMWMMILLGFYFVSVATSSTKFASLASAISIACVLSMTVTAIVQLGPLRMLQTMFYATSLYVSGSWFVYLFVPSIGVFQEPTVGGEFVARMGGLAHPNTLGQVSGLTLVLGLLLYREEKKFSLIRTVLILLAVGALAGSLSRTSLLASIVGVAIVFREHLFQRKYLMTAVIAGFVGLVVLLGASMFTDVGQKVQGKLGMLSKSGDASELTSATGRTEIWGYALQLLAERPVTGYGAATSKFYLQDYSMYTHNLVLNIAFSTGMIGGLFALWMCLERAFRVIFYRHRIADALVVFILVNGLFENVIFSVLCGLPTILWIIGLALPVVDQMARKNDDLLVPDGRILRFSKG